MKLKSILIFSICLWAMTFTGCGKNTDTQFPNGEVKVYNWGEYIDETLIDEFEQTYGIDVIYDTFNTNEEMYPKIESNPSLYDVVCPSEYMIAKMIEKDLLAPLNYDNIPNIVNIGETYMTKAQDFDPNNTYCVPYTYGTVGILYNTTMVDEEITSWSVLWDEKYKNNIIMQDSVRDAFMIAFKMLGYSSNTTEEAKIFEASALLKKQYPLVKAYAIDETRDKMINGAAALGIIYSGEYLVCIEENEDLAYVVPEEGSNVWIDGWVVPKGAKNKENAEKWINFLCTKEAAIKNFYYIGYATPNVAAMEDLEEEYLNDPAVFPTDEILDRCEFFTYLGEEVDNLYYEYWKKVKTIKLF